MTTVVRIWVSPFGTPNVITDTLPNGVQVVGTPDRVARYVRNLSDPGFIAQGAKS